MNHSGVNKAVRVSLYLKKVRERLLDNIKSLKCTIKGLKNKHSLSSFLLPLHPDILEKT